MASIGKIHLDIQKVPNTLRADVEVTYTIAFDESDVSTNREYREVVELIGADDGPLNTRDEIIRFGVGKVPFFSATTRANGSATADAFRPRRVELRELNEDRPGRDEIRARVILRDGTRQVTRDSNLVIDDFNPANV